jgi:hypothetical protein
MDRRDFLTAVAAAGAVSLAGCSSAPVPLPPGDLLGASLDLGHRLRERNFAPPGETRQVPVLIVGAGIGGLAAGWKLAQSGFADFLIVELESEAGGNSRAGSNAVSAYPWGAHYLPLPTREATAVRELLAELGVLQGDPRAVQPVYDERYLCATPQERLYRHGRWQEGLLPQTGVSAAERHQYQQFGELMEDFRLRRDGLGRRAFALPMALSSRAPELLALDRISMRDWLLAQGFDSPHLHWYVNYACRDDYGTGSAAVSAWAGIHYFACRDGEAQNAGSETVLTAPAGNAWLVAGMLRSIRARVGERLLTACAGLPCRYRCARPPDRRRSVLARRRPNAAPARRTTDLGRALVSRSPGLRRTARAAGRRSQLQLRALAGRQPDLVALPRRPCRRRTGLGQRPLRQLPAWVMWWRRTSRCACDRGQRCSPATGPSTT